ncbi:MAG: chromosomal replication initiator protein DnaA [Patescibacteria group bacterium]
MHKEELWKLALGEIELSISKANFVTWFKNTHILSMENGHVIIGVPNGFAKEWLENKYRSYILKALQHIESGVSTVSCKISVSSDTPREPSVDAIISPQKSLRKASFKPKSSASILDANLNPKYTFENFVIGGNNELARAACYAVSQSPGRIYNPLFIYGGVGLGKTHLLQSIGNEILQKDPAFKIKYISSERFTNDLITSLQTNKISDFKDYYQKIDLLIIDDIQFISGKEKTQEEFFHIFNYLYQLNKQIVLSSDRPPKAIQILEERLRSRFEGGMIADVSQPDFETRVAILRKRAQEEALIIEEEAINFIAENVVNNIRELEGALNRVIASAQLTGQRLSFDFVSSTLASLISSGKKKGVSYKDVLRVISDFYEVDINDLLRKNRKKEVVKPRQIAMYLLRTELNFSYPGIGGKIGGRDHTTALHAFEKITQELALNEKLQEELKFLKERLYSL